MGFGKLWDSWGGQMRVFWNSYMVAPWDNWSLGLTTVALCTPSNQPPTTATGRPQIPQMQRGSVEAPAGDRRQITTATVENSKSTVDPSGLP